MTEREFDIWWDRVTDEDPGACAVVQVNENLVHYVSPEELVVAIWSEVAQDWVYVRGGAR